MRKAAAVLLIMAVLCGVSCGEKPPKNDKPESSDSEVRREVSADDLAKAVYSSHMELSALAYGDPVFTKAVAVGEIAEGDVFGDRFLTVMPEAKGGEYLLIHRENGSLEQVFAHFPGEEEIGCRGECSDISELNVSGWAELVADCEAAGGLPGESETLTLTGEELCRNADKAITPELTVTGIRCSADEVWLETEDPGPGMTGYMGAGYTLYTNDRIDSAVLTLTYDPELIFIPDQSPENFTPAMYRYSPDGSIDEVPGQTVQGNSITAEIQPSCTYILANKKALEQSWDS